MAKNNTIGEFDGKIADKVVVLEGVVDLGNMNTPIVSVDGKAALAVYPLAGTADLQSLNNSISVIDGKLCRSSIAYDGVLDLQDLNSILCTVDDEKVIAVYIIEGTPTISSNTDKFISIDGKLAIAIHELDGFACLILKDAVLNLTTIQGNKWTDSISGNDTTFVNSNAFNFKNDTYIDMGIKQKGGEPFKFHCKLNLNSVGANQYLFANSYSSTQNGILFLIGASGDLFIIISKGAAGDNQTVNVGNLSASTDYDINVDWDGVIGVDNMTVIINEVSTDYSITHEWVGLSSFNTFIGTRPSPLGYLDGVISVIEWSFNITDYSIPFQIGESNTVYCVNSDTDFTIIGTVDVTNWVLQDLYHYSILNGFNLVGTAKIPASKLNPGFDVEGNILSNPAIPNGHNGAETEYLPPDIAAFKAIDTLNKWYTVGGDPIPQSFANTENNIGDYLFFNIIDPANNRSQGVMFDPPLTIEQQEILDRCYIKSIDIPEGYEAELDANGLLQYDSNYELLLIPIV